mgnify:CR=1 FL=1
MQHNGKHIDDMSLAELRTALRDIKQVVEPAMKATENDDHGGKVQINLKELQNVCK